MTPCPLCAHPLYHEPPPVPLPYARVWCDNCQGWLCWTGEPETPLCPQAHGMAYRVGKYGGFYGCLAYPRCKTIVKAAPLRLRLVPWATEQATEDEKHFARLDREAQERRTRLESQAARHKRKWWLGGGLDDLVDASSA